MSYDALMMRIIGSLGFRVSTIYNYISRPRKENNQSKVSYGHLLLEWVFIDVMRVDTNTRNRSS